MEREQQPVVIVDERGIDFVFHLVRLRVQLRAKISRLYGFTVLIFSLIGDLVLFGFPNPLVRNIHSGELCVPGIADRFDLPELIQAIVPGNLCDREGRGVGSLFGCRLWRLFLRTGGGRKDQRKKNQ